jgi:orotidine-5'-phosphate decarboxylase
LGAWKGTLRFGLDQYIAAIMPHLGDLKLIYDHQKAATDIPDLAGAMIDLADAGVHAVIFFPFGGRVTQEKWTKAAIDAGLAVLVGGQMTQDGFLQSQGGYIHDDAPELIYRRAVQHGVRDFVVPGNRPEAVQKFRGIILDELDKQGVSVEEAVLYAPGFVKQGGVISDTGQVAGPSFHAIVGSVLVRAEDVEAAAVELTSQLAA